MSTGDGGGVQQRAQEEATVLMPSQGSKEWEVEEEDKEERAKGERFSLRLSASFN